jgi:hypothetical protein
MNAWRQAIAAVGRLLDRLSSDGITLEMLNLGGGFPARSVESVPSIDQIANTIESALHELLPYRPELLAVEPGRYLVAESAVLVGGVLGREVRGLPAGHPRRGRPALRRLGRRLHPQLPLPLQRVPAARAGLHRSLMTRLRRLIATALVDSFGLSLGWTVFSLHVVRSDGLAALGLCNAAMLVGVALSAPVAARLSAYLDGRALLRVTCSTESVLRVGTFVLLLAGAPLGVVAVAVAASNVVAWTGYAGMRAEVAAADPRGAAMTWYMVAVAAIEAAGTATAALLPTGPGGLVTGGLLVAVIACYGGVLLPTWLVAAGARVPAPPGRTRGAGGFPQPPLASGP